MPRKEEEEFPDVGECWVVFSLMTSGLVVINAIDTTQNMADRHVWYLNMTMDQHMVIRRWIEKRCTNHLFVYEPQMAVAGLLSNETINSLKSKKRKYLQDRKTQAEEERKRKCLTTNTSARTPRAYHRTGTQKRTPRKGKSR